MADKSYGFNVFAAQKGFDTVVKGLEKLGRTLDEIDRKRATAQVDVDTAKAEAKVGKFARDLQGRIERAVRNLPDIDLKANSSAADRRIVEIRRELAALSSKRIGVDVDAGAAQAQVNRLSAELARLSARSPNIQVRTDTAAASAALLGVSALARRVDGQRVAISVNASDVSRAISLLGLLTAALAAASAMAAPAAAGIAALGPLAGAGAQGIGALAAGFNGVGDAVKALSDAETKAAAGTAVSAASRVNSAQAIVAAQRQVEQAHLQADRAAITGAQQVADARKALADAEADAAERVADAERALGDAREQAAQSAVNAERTLRQAQQASADAQLELNRARTDAIERLEDLGLALRGVVLDEREALLELRDAQNALEEGFTTGASGDELERLQIRVERAQLSLDATRERFGDLREESDAYARSGVEGSDQVVAAQRRVAESAEAVADAQAALVQAQRDGARDVADAEASLTKARVDGARQVSDAQERVARAQQQAAWAQADAARQVEDAQRALANAYTDSGNVGATSMNKVKEAMEGLSPEAQRFAHFLVAEVLPGLRGIRDAVQATLLPRMETSLRTLGQLTPIVSAGLAETGQVIGDLSVKGAEMMTSGPWRRDFATLMAGNNRVLEDFGEVGLDVLDMFRNLGVSSQPMLERFSQATERAAELARQWLETKRASGELDQFFSEMGDTILELVHIAGQLITASVQISQALGPMGMVILQAVGNLAEMIGKFAEANPTLTQLVATVGIAVAAFAKLGNMFAGAGVLIPSIIGGWKSLGGLMTGMQRGMDAAALSAGVLTERLTGNAAAGERVATAGGKVASAASKIGATLPFVGAAVVGLGLAYDGLVTSSDEAADALLKGGAAADEVTRKLQEQRGFVEKYFGGTGLGDVAFWLVPGMEEASAKARELYNALSPLEQAQVDVTQATNAYNQAVREHGPNSTEAAAAADRLADATNKVEQRERAAEDATRDLTDALIGQRTEMLGGIDASLRFESAQLAVERAQRSYTQAVTDHGVTSFEARDAENQYGQALIASVTAAGEAARAQNAHKDAADQNALAVQAQNDEIWRLIQVAGVNAPEALLSMAAGMSDTELKARGATVRVNELGQRVLELPGGPGKPPHTLVIDAYTGPAQAAIDRFVRDNDGRRIGVKVDVQGGTGIRFPSGVTAVTNRVGRIIEYQPMATGGWRSMASGVANVVPPNTPTLIGDHPRVPESYIPLDPGSPRSHRILDVSAVAMGRRILPMADGGTLGTGRQPFWPRAFARGGGPPGVSSMALPEGMDPEKASEALRRLAETLRDRLTPALEDAGTLIGVDTKKSIADLATTTTDRNALMGQSWDELRDRLRDRAFGIQRSVTDLQATHNWAWSDMRTRAGAEVGTVTGPIFGGLHAGMDAVGRHAVGMADWVGSQYARLRSLTADPVRWSLDWPVNRGLVPAWNSIDRFFALNRPMPPVPIGFSTGGKVPGSGSGDTVPALLTPGEFVVRKQIAEPTKHFLAALNEGQAEAIQAAGGRFARFALGGTVEQGQAWARAQHGKPYIWGGVGPAGYDCSGFQSAIVGVLTGGPVHQRRFTTASFAGGPTAGFIPGLSSAYGIGVFQGNPGHVAGTLGGLNVESGGSPSMTKAGPGAAGATHRQFRQHFSLPQVGGRFIPGGPDGFDVQGYLRKEFANTRKMIAEIVPRYGPGNPPFAMTRFGNDAVDGATKDASGFDRGGYARGTGWMFKRTVRPERVLDPRTTEAFEQMVRVLGTVRGAMPTLLGAAQPAVSNALQAAGPDLAAFITALGRQIQAAMPQIDGARLRIEDDGHNGLARVVARQQQRLARR